MGSHGVTWGHMGAHGGTWGHAGRLPTACRVAQARALLQEQLGQAQEALREWQGKYERRESRPEDIATIEAMKKQARGAV
eukprot:5198092-Prymnesium_polylepis.1